MPIRKVVIVTPAAPGSRSGNRNTATRWARILRRLGHDVAITTEWRGEPADLMIALHARRSHASVQAFHDAVPDRPLILALTGTDLYRDIRTSKEAQHSLDLATRFIVLQEAGPDELTPAQRALARVIYQSEVARVPHRPPRRIFRVCVLGHLREEKDPFRAALALRHVPADLRFQLVQAGKPMSPEMEAEARALMRAEPRYRWIGEMPHWKALRLLAGSHVMVISSRMEGGAHVVSEAIAHGVPVIASDIAGNRGMLGADYPGYYPLEDEYALARLLLRAYYEPAFLDRLAVAVEARRGLIAPEREMEAWRKLLAEVS
jgi:putative glycosyltransferase (TIGR04348 family)